VVTGYTLVRHCNSPKQNSPHKARVIGDGLTAASRTPVQVTSQSCRAAVPDGAQHFQLRPCQMAPVSVDEAVARRTNDVGHLEGGPIHLLFLVGLRRAASGPLNCMSSIGLATACKWRCDKCK
jgi:hypothetical protein